MRILFLARYFPYPAVSHAGGIYIYRLIESLCQRGHQVSLLSFTDQEEARHIREMEGICQHVITVPMVWSARQRLAQLPHHILKPPHVARSAHPAMRAAIRQILGDAPFDIAQVEYTEMGQYVGMLRPVPTVLDEIDVSILPFYRLFLSQRSPVHRAWKWWWWRTSEAFEPAMCARFDHVLVRSDKDRDFLLAKNPSLHISVLDPWIDETLLIDPLCARDTKVILFVGHMGRPLNADAVLWFYREVFPIVAAQEPGVRLVIAGASPLRSVQALSSDDRVTITGSVPDVMQYYRSSRVFVAPLLAGGGIIKKVVDAMAIGCPVVSTSVGVEGVGAEDNCHVLVRNTPDAFADAVVRLLRDDPLWQRLAANAREFVRRRYDWSRTVDSIEALYARLRSAARATA